MNELLLAKMLFVYENTVGAFTSNDVLDLFSYYGEATNEKGFEKWLSEIELEKEWLEYRDLIGLDNFYNQ